jgi:3-phenylpropionate/trans-cinnamate dioxygenase ferredoxin reductase subunit
MSTLHVKYAVVGGGGAGSAAAQAIRRHDAAGSILLVGQEHSRPYERPALSKAYLRRQKTRLEIASEPVGWYSQRHIEMRTSRRVSHLDTARQCLTMDNGEEISFDKLLIATGASPKLLRVSGADLPNVFYLRTIDDCDRLHHAIDKAKAEGRPHPTGRGRAAVIGGGLLAVEIAAALRQMDLHVELICPRLHVWGKYAGETTGRFITKYLESKGVIVHPESQVERLDGDGRVQRVIIAEGATVDCDFSVAAIGIVPNREILRNTPIAAEKAILIDDHCRTNVAGIFAAGDCAAVLDPLFGKHRILDHWSSARRLGDIAGANMAGVDVKYEGINHFSSEVFDIRLNAWGEARFVDRRIIRGTPNLEARDFAEIGVAADGRISQILAIGRTEEHEAFRRLTEQRVDVNGLEETLMDPESDLNAI